MVDAPIIRPNRNGTPSVRGTRLTIYSIMDFHLAGESAETIAGLYRIEPEEARAAMEYIDQNREQLMPRYNAIVERNRRGNPPEIARKLAESHEKLMG